MSLEQITVKGPKRTAALLLSNPFDRFDLGEGVVGWVYTFENRSVIPIPPHTSGALEIAVELEGHWDLDVFGHPRQSFEQGDVFTVPQGVRHTYGFRAGRAPGLQVGFAIHLSEHPRLGSSLLVWKRPRLDGRAAKGFQALAEAVVAWRRGIDAAAPGIAPSIRSELFRLVDDQLDLPSDGPVIRARRELETHLDRPLYLAHLADIAGLHEKALSRRFLEHAGVSPIRFRTELRLARAIRLLWSRPELSVAAAAHAVGFESPRFFHRLAVRTFGLTPAELARRRASAGFSRR